MKKGKFGETLAKNFLIKKGYSIIKENFRTRFGEIDLIVEKNNILTFVEVKYRTNQNFGNAEESINHFKLMKIKNSALQFIKNLKKNYKSYQIDVVAINNFGTLEINHYENIEL